MGDSTVTLHPAVARGPDSLGGRLYSIDGMYSEDSNDLGFVEFAGTGGVGYKVSTVVWAYDCAAFADFFRRWPARHVQSTFHDPEESCNRLGGWLQYPSNIYRGM